MYVRRRNGSRTGSVEKRATSEERELDNEADEEEEEEEETRRDASKSVRYGLTSTPSRDENLLGTNDTLPSRVFNAKRVDDRKDERSFGKAYELNLSEDLPRVDRERYFEMRKKFSVRTAPAAVSSYTNSNNLESHEYWLSGEKFFRTPPQDYNNDDVKFIIPTRDNSNGSQEDADGKGPEQGGKSNSRSRRDDVSPDLLKLSFLRAMGSSMEVYDSNKTLIDSIDDFKATNEMIKYEADDAIDKSPLGARRRSSSASSRSREEENVTDKNFHGPSSRSMIENVSSSDWNVLENVAVPGAANIHNHIYLSSRYFDRYFDIPLSKFLKLTRKKARVSRIRRRILKRSKRSRNRLKSAACQNSSVTFEVESVNNNSGKEQKERAYAKKDVCDVLTEIDAELAANLRSVEKLREKLPNCIPINAASTPEIKRTLNEVARRCKDCIYNSNDRVEAAARMSDLLLKTVYDLRDVVKREKLALLQEEQYYTRLQLVSIQGREDFQKIKRLRNNDERAPLNGLGGNLCDRKVIMKELMGDIMALMSDICSIEDNKENIKKPTNRKTNDQEAGKNRPVNKKADDGKANRERNGKESFMRKECKGETQMSLLSKVRPTVRIGKNKIFTKDTDGNKDRIKDETLRDNEDRAERQSLDKARRSVHTVSSNFGNYVTGAGARLEISKVIKDRKNNNGATTPTSPINADILCDRGKQPIVRRKRQSSSNASQPVWKPGGAIKSFDKENAERTRSVPVKHANPLEPAASKRSVFKENRKNEHFREERVTKLCKLLAEVKTQKGSKDGDNVLSETRSSIHTQSEVPPSASSRAFVKKIQVKSSEVNLTKNNSGPKPRPGIHRSVSNNKNNHPCVLQPETKTLLQDKSETFEHFSSERNASELVTLDTTKSSMHSVNVTNKLSTKLTNARSSGAIGKSEPWGNEFAKNKTKNGSQAEAAFNSSSCNPQKILVSTLSANIGVNMDHDIRSERRPSFVSFADVSCNADFSSTSNSTTMVPSSKCCQVSLSSSSSRICSNCDQHNEKNKSNEITHTMEKDSLESLTDDDREEDYESKDPAVPYFDVRALKNGHEISLDSLKEFLRYKEINIDLVERAEDENKVESDCDRRKSMRQLSETPLINVSKNNSAKTAKSPLVKIPIGPETQDSDSAKKYEFKSDDNGSGESSESRSSNYLINAYTEKIDDSTLGRQKSKSSQTISYFKELCDACTDAEDIKSDCSTYVDATISCYEMGLKVSSRDVGTEIFLQDKSVPPPSPRRMVQTQTNPYSFSTNSTLTDIAAKLENDQEEGKDNINDRCVETTWKVDFKCEQPKYDEKKGITMTPRHDTSRNDLGESSKLLLNVEDVDAFTVRPPLLESSMRQAKGIKEQLRSVDPQSNKLHVTAKGTSDAYSEISATTSFAPKSMEMSTTSLTSRFSKEPPFEQFGMDPNEASDNDGVSSDLINAFQTIAWYAMNFYEAIKIYREHSNRGHFKEYSSSNESLNLSERAKSIKRDDTRDFVNEDPEHSNRGHFKEYSSSNESLNLSERAKSIKRDDTRDFVNEGPEYSHDNDINEKTSCFDGRSYRIFNEPGATDSSDESDDETESFTSFGFKDFYNEKVSEATSQKSSHSSIFFVAKGITEKVEKSSSSLKNPSLEMMKYPEKICRSSKNDEREDLNDSSDFVLSREALLLLTYLTICAFVFCCLKFSMTCESLILH